MDVISLRSDCGRCVGLCCVALAFDRSPSFAIDKAAGSPCPNLGTEAHCTIHARRAELGFSGCVQYDCLGAGQRVVQNLFHGMSLQEQRSFIAPMLDAFWATRIAHQHLELLELAASLPLTVEQDTQRRQVVLSLCDPSASLDRIGQLTGEAKAWLRQLSGSTAVIARSQWGRNVRNG